MGRRKAGSTAPQRAPRRRRPAQTADVAEDGTAVVSVDSSTTGNAESMGRVEEDSNNSAGTATTPAARTETTPASGTATTPDAGTETTPAAEETPASVVPEEPTHNTRSRTRTNSRRPFVPGQGKPDDLVYPTPIRDSNGHCIMERKAVYDEPQNPQKSTDLPEWYNDGIPNRPTHSGKPDNIVFPKPSNESGSSEQKAVPPEQQETTSSEVQDNDVIIIEVVPKDVKKENKEELRTDQSAQASTAVSMSEPTSRHQTALISQPVQPITQPTNDTDVVLHTQQRALTQPDNRQQQQVHPYQPNQLTNAVVAPIQHPAGTPPSQFYNAATSNPPDNNQHWMSNQSNQHRDAPPSVPPPRQRQQKPKTSAKVPPRQLQQAAPPHQPALSHPTMQSQRTHVVAPSQRMRQDPHVPEYPQHYDAYRSRNDHLNHNPEQTVPLYHMDERAPATSQPRSSHQYAQYPNYQNVPHQTMEQFPHSTGMHEWQQGAHYQNHPPQQWPNTPTRPPQPYYEPTRPTQLYHEPNYPPPSYYEPSHYAPQNQQQPVFANQFPNTTRGHGNAQQWDQMLANQRMNQFANYPTSRDEAERLEQQKYQQKLQLQQLQQREQQKKLQLQQQREREQQQQLLLLQQQQQQLQLQQQQQQQQQQLQQLQQQRQQQHLQQQQQQQLQQQRQQQQNAAQMQHYEQLQRDEYYARMDAQQQQHRVRQQDPYSHNVDPRRDLFNAGHRLSDNTPQQAEMRQIDTSAPPNGPLVNNEPRVQDAGLNVRNRSMDVENPYQQPIQPVKPLYHFDGQGTRGQTAPQSSESSPFVGPPILSPTSTVQPVLRELLSRPPDETHNASPSSGFGSREDGELARTASTSSSGVSSGTESTAKPEKKNKTPRKPRGIPKIPRKPSKPRAKKSVQQPTKLPSIGETFGPILSRSIGASGGGLMTSNFVRNPYENFNEQLPDNESSSQHRPSSNNVCLICNQQTDMCLCTNNERSD